ncbi:MAG: hypothetical protein CMJ46_16255 [Planctomyces sp.]|nr:hypothetical protein [Planctomyces sp.]
MKKLLAYMLVTALLAVSAEVSVAKSKQKTPVPPEVGYFYVPGTQEVVSHEVEARLQKEQPELLTVSFQAPDAPPAEPLPYPQEPTSVYSDGPALSSGMSAAPMQLYHCVEVEDRHNIHPCAVTKIVSVLDPCPPACGSCGGCDSCNSCGTCCPRGCVFVQICVPPCGCPEVKVSRHGSKVKYDYGEYEVEITSDDGVVKVDYDD